MSVFKYVINAVIVLAAFSPPALAGGGKLDRALEAKVSSGAKGGVQVIITGNRDAVRGKLAARNRQIIDEYPSIDAIAAIIDAEDLKELEKDSAVRGVSLDAPVAAHQTAGSGADSLIGLDLVRSFVGADRTGLTGRGVGVAIIDSGIANTPDLHDNLGTFYDFRKSPKTAPADDTFGHGTHVAATIGSTGKQNAYRYRGIAPNVRLIGFRVLEGNGSGLTSNVINALTYATANKAALGIDIINLSLGHPIYESASTDPLVQAVEKAVHAGILVVVRPATSASTLTPGCRATAGLPRRAMHRLL